MIIKSLAVSLFIISSALAHSSKNNNTGLGTYAIQHRNWPCDKMMLGFNGVRTLRVSMLYHTFGSGFKCLDRWASDPRPKVLQMHLINEVCQRNRNCGPYEIGYKLKPRSYRRKILTRDKRLLSKLRTISLAPAKWFRRHSRVQCVLSAGLETNLDRTTYKALVGILRPLFPERCKWVYNPVEINRYGVKPIKSMIFEQHGGRPHVTPPCITNFDGLDISLKARPNPAGFPVKELPRFLASYASCDASYLWIAEFNGRGSGAFVDPRLRRHWPTRAMLRELNKYLRKDMRKK